ncbi:hypothetical protein llap_18902 [Limosa lapponica baueri]|uniref:Uncharacterized protein n=1 Tax=Limosa lapponica baueri TaxID=1758121 RepID=A0A2I0TAH7_LIMLA|nr:hypothetical protein llap_18902 [Limosa lapponica baueri]
MTQIPASSVLEGEESATIDFRDRNDTEFEELPTLLPTRLHSVTNLLQFGQLMTTESAFAPTEDGENSTGYEANTENIDAGVQDTAEESKGFKESDLHDSDSMKKQQLLLH